MLRSMKGSRRELEQAARDRAEGWSHLGSPRRAALHQEASAALARGEQSVTAGVIVYEVVAESDDRA